MQQPTCTGIRIRSTSDAHKIFRAVQVGILHMVTRRLDADERAALCSGCIYAWEERGPHSEITGLGIERFTEGRRWSPSRVRDEFLFYYEKYAAPSDATHLSSATERQPPRDWDPLVKQTYSVWVETEKGRRKWHLTAYFTQATFDQLRVVDDNPDLRDLTVPEGTFKSTRVAKSRTKNDDHSRSENPRTSSSASRHFAHPSPYHHAQQAGSPSMTPVLMHEPYQTTAQNTYQAHSHSPAAYQHSPSPVSPQIPGQYFPTHHSYADSTGSPPYVDTRYPTALSPVSPSVGHYHQLPYQLPTLHNNPDDLRLAQPYHSTPRAPAPSGGPSSSAGNHSGWNGGPSNSMYRESGDILQHAHHLTATHSYSASMQTDYGTPQPPSGPPTMHSSSHGYPSSQPPSSIHSSNHGSPSNNTSALYSPSYSSLHSALSPNSLIPDSDVRAPTLSPLHIPDRPHAATYGQTNLESAIEEQPEGQNGLAPLDELKRLSRYRRDPQDEKALRLLRPPTQPTP